MYGKPLTWKESWRRKEARRVYLSARRSGRIPKPDRCERCGCSPEKKDLHGHHTDYSKPLVVVWLCKDCHEVAHAR